jgi:hypothetical protein
LILATGPPAGFRHDPRRWASGTRGSRKTDVHASLGILHATRCRVLAHKNRLRRRKIVPGTADQVPILLVKLTRSARSQGKPQKQRKPQKRRPRETRAREMLGAIKIRPSSGNGLPTESKSRIGNLTNRPSAVVCSQPKNFFCHGQARIDHGAGRKSRAWIGATIVKNSGSALNVSNRNDATTSQLQQEFHPTRDGTIARAPPSDSPRLDAKKRSRTRLR